MPCYGPFDMIKEELSVLATCANLNIHKFVVLTLT